MKNFVVLLFLFGAFFLEAKSFATNYIVTPVDKNYSLDAINDDGALTSLSTTLPEKFTLVLQENLRNAEVLSTEDCYPEFLGATTTDINLKTVVNSPNQVITLPAGTLIYGNCEEDKSFFKFSADLRDFSIRTVEQFKNPSDQEQANLATFQAERETVHALLTSLRGQVNAKTFKEMRLTQNKIVSQRLSWSEIKQYEKILETIPSGELSVSASLTKEGKERLQKTLSIEEIDNPDLVLSDLLNIAKEVVEGKRASRYSTDIFTFGSDALAEALETCLAPSTFIFWFRESIINNQFALIEKNQKENNFYQESTLSAAFEIRALAAKIGRFVTSTPEAERHVKILDQIKANSKNPIWQFQMTTWESALNESVDSALYAIQTLQSHELAQPYLKAGYIKRY